MDKQKIIEALRAFINKRPGLDYAHYGQPAIYRNESRAITRDLNHARRLLRDIELRDSITAQDIIKASESAFSGRLTIDYHNDQAIIKYCVGQYFPTEYRKAVAAVCASVLWDWKRDQAMPKGHLVHNSETGETFERYNGLRAGDWLRQSFSREYGRTIANRWFN
jgi:hypothetical protein